MSRITAVLLSLGEETTDRAVESVKNQTRPPEELIRIEGVIPFHKALNLGVSKVTTEFFVQVDADVVLEPYCFESLMEQMRPSAGLVFGSLRDPLLGKISAVKMFRKACFDRFPFGDSVSPDTDFYRRIIGAGWQALGVLEYRAGSTPSACPLGRHEPSYTPLYTFSKFLLEGQRKLYRNHLSRLREEMGLLCRSRHPASLFALIGLANGVFVDNERDGLVPFKESGEFRFLVRFLAGRARSEKAVTPIPLAAGEPVGLIFERFYKGGAGFRRSFDSPGFTSVMNGLREEDPEAAWPAVLGLGRGLFIDDLSQDRLGRDLGVFSRLMAGGA